MAASINHALLASIAALEARAGGTTAPRIARELGIPISTATGYLARVRGHARVRHQRYIVLCSDPYLDDDFAVCSRGSRKSAERIAAKLNRKYLKAFPGWPPLKIPLVYVVAESMPEGVEESIQ